MGIGSILSGIGAASSILGGLSGNKQKAMPGAQIRPMEEQLSEMDKLRAYLAENTSYNPRPTRRLTAPELEGAFAPVAVREIQNYFDTMYPGQSAYGDTQKQEDAAQQGAGKTIAQYIPAPQKGGGEGFYLLSDGTKVSESEMSAYQAKQSPGWRGDIDQQRILGQNYGKAQTPKPLSSSELDALRAILAKGAA